MKKRFWDQMLWTSVLAVAIGLVWSRVGATQERAQVVPADAAGVGGGNQVGWTPKLKLDGTFALSTSKRVPGATDGTTLQLGGLLDASVGHLSINKRHDWSVKLGAELSFARSPALDVFVKSVDHLDFRSDYLYHFPTQKWLGPFVAVRLTSTMLASDEVRAEPADVVRLEVGASTSVDANGNTVDDQGVVIDVTDPRVTHYGAATKIPLTDPFMPMTIRESAGFFVLPYDKPVFKMDMRLGLGAWETVTKNGYVVADNKDTPLLELQRLQDINQFGAEFGILAGGEAKGKLSYGFSALLMQPIVYDVKTDLTGMDLMNIELEGKIGVSFLEYFSLTYNIKAYRQPVVVDDWQVQTNLLLTVGILLPRPAPEPQELPAAQ